MAEEVKTPQPAKTRHRSGDPAARPGEPPPKRAVLGGAEEVPTEPEGAPEEEKKGESKDDEDAL